MSRKPPKKSDLGKSWMKPSRDSRQMISPEYHLIVSEGTKTEPKYFEKIKETIYHPIWSNQCIELWFLLHFMFLQADLHRDAYCPKLTECLKSKELGIYYKNRTDMFDVLLPYMDDAIRNAKMLEKINAGRTPSRSAPGTMIHHLMEILKPYL